MPNQSSQQSQPKTNQQQLGWINNLRFFALFAVIILHCASPLLGGWGKVPFNQWMSADFYNALTRFAVPAFVMITGALSLEKDDDVFVFLKKRLGRVVVPFLFWSLVYIAYAFYNEDIPWSADAWVNIKQVLHLLRDGASYHLWYVYMLIGLYLIMPILNKFIRAASEKEILYFLGVWLLIMLFAQPYMSKYNPAVDVRYFGGYIGYLVLGYYLSTKTFDTRNLGAWMVGLFILSVIIITWGTCYFFNYYKGISTVMYEPLSWPIVILSVSALLLFKFVQFKVPVFFITIRDFVGKYNYGMYLGHALILTLLDYPELTGFSLSYKSFNPWFSIPVTAFACFCITLPTIWLVNKIPFIGKHISG